MVAESTAAQPSLAAPPGEYVVHLAFGLASATKRISLGDEEGRTASSQCRRVEIIGARGDAPIDASRLSLAIYVPERNNPEAKLVYAKAKAGDLVGLPEGATTSCRPISIRSASGRERRHAEQRGEQCSRHQFDRRGRHQVPSGKVLEVTCAIATPP